MTDKQHQPVGGDEADIQDGFRTRRKRSKGWEAKAIRDGLIADPDDTTDRTGQAWDGERWVTLGESRTEIAVPTATLKGQ